MKVHYSNDFLCTLKHLDPKIKERVKERIKIFEENSYYPLLNNHALHGKYKGKRSINITGDWRAIYYMDGADVIFSELGRHTDLYH